MLLFYTLQMLICMICFIDYFQFTNYYVNLTVLLQIRFIIDFQFEIFTLWPLILGKAQSFTGTYFLKARKFPTAFLSCGTSAKLLNSIFFLNLFHCIPFFNECLKIVFLKFYQEDIRLMYLISFNFSISHCYIYNDLSIICQGCYENIF